MHYLLVRLLALLIWLSTARVASSQVVFDATPTVKVVDRFRIEPIQQAVAEGSRTVLTQSETFTLKSHGEDARKSLQNNGAGTGGRTRMGLRPADFKSAASASSAIPATNLSLKSKRPGLRRETRALAPSFREGRLVPVAACVL